MGGLVARSALHQAAAAGQDWPGRVQRLVCLGTPHHGAPLERAGHGVDLLLAASPYTAAFGRLRPSRARAQRRHHRPAPWQPAGRGPQRPALRTRP
jgi:hypothetical protein